MKRTPSVDVDQPFEFVCDVTKTYVDPAGYRVFRGVASGVAEDRDGERVSANAIRKMAAQSTAAGQVKITASHDQDWHTEFGEVTKLSYDAASDELLYEARLPPEGEDALADKAWKRLERGERLGVSIGGRLKKAFHELAERGGRVVKRKVLDDIELRHLALTQKQSYRAAFAEIVGKTFTGDEPADELFVDEDVAKAKTPDDDEPEDKGADPETGAPDAAESGDADAPPAATGDTADETGDDEPSDAEAAQDLPDAKRHLSCPNCGTEFAAPMPKEGTDGDDPTPTPDEDDDQAQARKTSEEEHPMADTIKETVEKLRGLAETADAPVEKTAEVEPEAPVATVEKTETDAPVLGDVEKMLAASHRANAGAIEELTTKSHDAFEAIAKAVKGLADRIDALPQGRRSLGRVLPHAGEVEKTETETDDVAKQVADAEDPVTALKALNAARGIR